MRIFFFRIRVSGVPKLPDIQLSLGLSLSLGFVTLIYTRWVLGTGMGMIVRFKCAPYPYPTHCHPQLDGVYLKLIFESEFLEEPDYIVMCLEAQTIHLYYYKIRFF